MKEITKGRLLDLLKWANYLGRGRLDSEDWEIEDFIELKTKFREIIEKEEAQE